MKVKDILKALESAPADADVTLTIRALKVAEPKKTVALILSLRRLRSRKEKPLNRRRRKLVSRQLRNRTCRSQSLRSLSSQRRRASRRTLRRRLKNKESLGSSAEVLGCFPSAPAPKRTRVRRARALAGDRLRVTRSENLCCALIAITSHFITIRALLLIRL